MGIYTISEFVQLSINSPRYELSSKTIDILASLDVAMSAVAVAEETSKSNSPSGYHKDAVCHFSVSSRARRVPASRASRGGSKSDVDWATVPMRGGSTAVGEWTTAPIRGALPTARVVEVKEGVEKDINDIRTALNKISTKNYEKQKDAIVDHISEVVAREDAEKSAKDIQSIAQFIFDIASTNKFFSEMYADLYKALVDKFAVFSNILKEFVLDYTKATTAILYADPSVDYDGFCLYTKHNDRRKATASFIVMLMLRDVLSRKRVAKIVAHYMQTFLIYIETPDRGNEIEDIAEVLFVFITLGKAGIKHTECWTAYLRPTIESIAKMKPNSLPSLTNRAVFKFMDIMDKVRAE
jgi:hypothetical protein